MLRTTTIQLREITVQIKQDKDGFGYFISSEEIPEIDTFVGNEKSIANVVASSIKIYYKLECGRDVRVFMEVPALPGTRSVVIRGGKVSP